MYPLTFLFLMCYKILPICKYQSFEKYSIVQKQVFIDKILNIHLTKICIKEENNVWAKAKNHILCKYL